ncbi:MAG: CPBP family intramembrane metalloprotease [Chloroflexi bacterium]|nr:MAG: CPBP family intramembrane metalloprotease [Chloroflexota bacterium]TMF37830.1 MAG: CPBP family intramembrane metalloprotease [Chloroflexota bacterium]
MSAALRRQPLLWYFVLAFAWTWAFVIVFLILFPLPDILVRTTPGDFGPLIAAIVMSGIVAGRPGVKSLFRRMVQWRVGLLWYAFALIGIPLLYIASIAAVPGALGSFKAPELSTVLTYPVFYIVLLAIGGPLTEEPGWRGFALPRLQQRWGPLVGTVILGLMWAAWHLPNYFRPDWAAVNGGFSISGIAVFAIVAVSMSVIITWAFNHTRGSILIAILIHASLNFSQGLTGDLFPAAKNNEVGPVVALIVLALVLLVATRGRLGYPGSEPALTAMPAYSAP